MHIISMWELRAKPSVGVKEGSAVREDWPKHHVFSTCFLIPTVKISFVRPRVWYCSQGEGGTWAGSCGSRGKGFPQSICWCANVILHSDTAMLPLYMIRFVRHTRTHTVRREKEHLLRHRTFSGAHAAKPFCAPTFMTSLLVCSATSMTSPVGPSHASGINTNNEFCLW